MKWFLHANNFSHPYVEVNFFFTLLLERKEGRKRERNTDATEKRQLIASVQAQTGDRSHVPRPGIAGPRSGIEPTTFWLWDNVPTN